MNKNETFTGNPTSLGISRSKFIWHPVNSGTFKAGELVPFFTYLDVLPGSTYKVSLRTLVRSITPVAPTMDDLYLDVAFFYVPNRLMLSRQNMSPSVQDYEHSWQYFLGAQDSTLNMPLPDQGRELGYVSLKAGKSTVESGLWDWQGQQVELVNDLGVNPFWALAYYQVWNDFYRDPNTMFPVTFSVDGGVFSFTKNDEAGIVEPIYLNKNPLACVCPFHGYFGSALPWPQRNSEVVGVPLQGDLIPVQATDTLHFMGFKPSDTPTFNTSASWPAPGSVTGHLFLDSTGSLAAGKDGIPAGSTASALKYSNLVVSLENQVTINVNAMRLSVATQRYYEALARGGNRYGDMIHSIWNVRGDFPMATAEYLCSKRIPLNIIQVNNTAGNNVSTQTQSSLGSTGAFSLTHDESYMFTKSFTEHGVIIGVACVRPNDTFSQGIQRPYYRFHPEDYYLPQFANIGEQPILNREIFATGNFDTDSLVFGYQEAWADYRIQSNHVCGKLRPGKSLGYWTYANNFEKAPTLAGFLDGRRFVNNVDQTLQVTSTSPGVEYQFIGQFGLDIEAILPMPTYSIPGLIDHH